VDPAWIGRRVVTHTVTRRGANAERAVAAVDALIPIPDSLGIPEAAALLDDGSTALGLIEFAGVRAGEWVLVEAAAGGVGTLLVQLARAAGARVVGAARGRRKLDMAHDVGADAVVDYSEPGWPARVRAVTGGIGADVVFDGVGGRIGREAFDATATGGRFSIHGVASGALTVIDNELARQRQVTVIGIEQLQRFGAGASARVHRMLADAADGGIRPVIGQTYPLEEAAAAHAAMEARQVLGKTLLVI
jgi:NADPH2:quinone reductase